MGRLILVRHGQTQMNADGVYFGHLDPGLNDKGKDQLSKTAIFLKKHNYSYDQIYSSDLSRAAESAKIVNYMGKEIIYSDLLREINFGIFEGLSIEEIRKKYPDELLLSQDSWGTYNYETGESVQDLYLRTKKFIENLDLEKDILVVTHWGVINCAMCYFFSTGIEDYWKYDIENGRVCDIIVRGNYPILKGFNLY